MFLDANNNSIEAKNLSKDEKEKIKSLFNKEYSYKQQIAVYYDAWANDNDDDPVYSLLYSIISEFDTNFKIKETEDFLIKAAAVLETLTGKNINGVIGAFKGKDLLECIRKNKEIQERINQFFNSLLSEHGERLVIFIDELDRCKPSYAIKLLERIKHYFTNDKITFVFSTNIKELQHTVKRYYGQDFDACRYLNRFFNFQILLPPANIARFYQTLNYKDVGYVYDDVCNAIMEKYDLTIRERIQYIELTKIAANKPTHGYMPRFFADNYAAIFCSHFLVPVMIALNLFKKDQYMDFISGKDGRPLVEIAIMFSDHFSNLLNMQIAIATCNSSQKSNDL